MFEAKVRVQHPCPFCDFSALYPDARMTHWSNGQTDVLHVAASSRKRLEAVMAGGRRLLKVREWSVDGHSALAIMPDIRRRGVRAVMEVAEETGVWAVPPITYLEGWETHRVVAVSRRDFARFVDRMKMTARVEVFSFSRESPDTVRDLGILPARLLDGLTGVQVHVLASAYENGLFDLPARMRQRPVANREGMARSTFGEHLQKAQRKLVRNAYPYLKLRDSTKEVGESRTIRERARRIGGKPRRHGASRGRKDGWRM